MYGIKDKDFISIRDIFAGHENADKVILYGSRANSNYRDSSDIDLVMAGEKLELTEKFTIENELDDLLLPYKIDVDIPHNIQNADLIDHIRRYGITLFEKRTVDS